jgi:hypothetical protein
MKVYIDKLREMPYDLPMKDIKYLLKAIDGQIANLQSQRGILQKALEIQEQHGNGKPNVTISEERRVTNLLESEQIEKAILKINGDFKSKDVPAAAEAMFPGTTCNPDSVPSILHQMIEAKKLKYVSERSGRRGAIYRKP